MSKGCQISKRSLNWPPILLYNWLIQLVQTTNEEKTKMLSTKGSHVEQSKHH